MTILPSKTRTLSLLILAAAASSAAAQGSFQNTGETVLLTGQQCPGFPAGITVSTVTGMDPAVMDQNGTLLFRTTLKDTGSVGGITTSNDRVLYMGRSNGDLVPVLRADDPAPGIPGATLRGFSTTAGSGTFAAGPSYRISPFNELLFFNSNIYDANTPSNTPTTSDQCVFWGPVGSLFKVLREGEEVPFYGVGSGINWGTPATSNWWLHHVINSSGIITIDNPLTGAVTTGVDDAVLATGVPGGLSIISRKGDVLPVGGPSNPLQYGGEVVVAASGAFLSVEVAINEAGQVLHDMKFSSTTGTATAANDACLALYTPGYGDKIIAREGMDAPGFPAGTVQFGTPTNNWIVYASDGNLTSSGETFLLAYLIGSGVTASLDDQALYVGGANGWTKVVQRNDPTPIGGGVTYAAFSSTGMSITDNGTMAFVSQLNGTSGVVDNTALFYGTVAGGFTKVVQENDVVDSTTLPGLQAGTWYCKDIYNLGGSSTPRLNARGQMLFHLPLWNAAHSVSITPVVSYDPTFGMQLVLDTDEILNTTGGVNPTSAWTGTMSIASTAGSGDGSGYAWFNNNGDWVGRVTLTPSANGYATVRGHVGGFQAFPSSVDSAGGTQTWQLDAGAANAGRLYVCAGTLSGTRPGFVFGGSLVPLNQDFWFSVSLAVANGATYTNSWGLLDANGHANASWNFPPGFGWMQGALFHHAFVVLDPSVNATFVSEPTSVKLY